MAQYFSDLPAHKNHVDRVDFQILSLETDLVGLAWDTGVYVF